MLSFDEKEYWQFMLHAMHDLRRSLYCVEAFTYLLREDERRPTMTYNEWCHVLDRFEKGYGKLQTKMGSLIDLAYYNTVDRLERKDKVLVNELCRDMAGRQDVKVLYLSDIPDYYAVTTNKTALVKVLEILLRHATARVAERRDDSRERLVCLNVTERGAEGQLTFAVSDTGELPTTEENQRYLNPPADTDSKKVSAATEVYNCRLLVSLLGGFAYVDPDYKKGRRVIFSIAVQ